MSFLPGYKTYVAAAALAGFALLGWFTGQHDVEWMVRQLVEAFALVGLRAAVGKVEK